MRTVLITGGAGGIGSAISRKFAEEGYNVIVTYHKNEDKARDLVAELPGNGHSFFRGPIHDAEALIQLVSAVKEQYVGLDVLVNNAGITTPVSHEDLEGLTDDWIDRIFQTNVRGSFAMIRAFKSLLLEKGSLQKPSLIVNISSVAAQSGIGSNVAYCASKAAIDSITRSLGRALAPSIRVVSVSPGWVLGEYAQNIDPMYLQMQENLTPLARLATPIDVANAVFAMDHLLTFTTGSIFPVDGGRLLK